MRYFKGALSQSSLLWETSWDNYTLYLAAIGVDDDDKSEANKPKTDVIDVNNLF